jgi:hypothetical protein
MIRSQWVSKKYSKPVMVFLKDNKEYQNALQKLVLDNRVHVSHLYESLDLSFEEETGRIRNEIEDLGLTA